MFVEHHMLGIMTLYHCLGIFPSDHNPVLGVEILI